MAIKVITVKEDVFGANEEKAKQNQQHPCKAVKNYPVAHRCPRAA